MDDTELGFEVEALRATFGDDVQVLSDPLRVVVDVYPHTGEDVSKRYVEATLCFTLTDGYPAAGPPSITMQAKGLGDNRERELKQLLSHEAIQLAGELMLGHLCEVSSLSPKQNVVAQTIDDHQWRPLQVAKDYMTAENHPDSHCIFCLCSMSQQVMAASQLLKLPCYHVFHRWEWGRSAA